MRRTFAAAVLIIPSILLAAASMQRRTVWSGVYTDAQAIEGEALYRSTCSRCHGSALQGGSAFALAGESFMENWREDSVESLYTFIKTTMPPRAGNPLSDESALAVVSYILWSNYFPAGATALDTSGLSGIQIELQSGPRPLPTSALVQTVGCMTKAAADAWDLTNASEPMRTRKSDKPTPEELQSAQTRRLGSHTLRMQNFAMLGAFKPDSHEGHKMLAKGVLLRQGDSARLSLTSLEMLTETCR